MATSASKGLVRQRFWGDRAIDCVAERGLYQYRACCLTAQIIIQLPETREKLGDDEWMCRPGCFELGEVD